MKLSDFNIANHVHNRWCRFIIHRYLGQFLERNLSLDQLSVDLSKGEVQVQEVNINVHFVNEFFSAFKLPLKLIDGFIGEIIIEVPWTKLMSDSTNLRIKDLQLTFQAQDGTIDENNIASMLGSVVDKLVSSQELARSFYQDEEQNGEVDEEEGTEGIKAFTKVIDAIVSRFCMELTDTTIRFENKPSPNSEMCTAIEIRAKSVEFMDEQMKNCRLENRTADTITSQPQGIGAITNLNKYVYLTGVELFTDVFSRIDEVPVGDPSSSSLILTSMYLRREKMKQKSPTMSPNESMNADLFTSTMTSVTNFQSCHSTLPTSTQTITDQFQVTRAVPELLSNPVKFAELSGEHCAIIIRIQNSDQASETSDYRMDLEVSAKGLNVFITPSQIEMLKKFFTSVTLPVNNGPRNELGKRMGKEDYDVIVRAMEDITMQGPSGNRTTAFGGGNWRQPEDFREFADINLDDNRKAPVTENTTGNTYSTLKGTGRKESTHVKASLGVAVIIVSHDDIFSHESVKKFPNKYHGAIDHLHTLSQRFFQNCSQLRIHAMTPLHTIREQMDRLYPENHLRIVGSSFAVKFDLEKYSNFEHTKFTLNATNLDLLEYLTEGSNPLEPQRRHYPLLDFSEYENAEHEPQLKIVYASSNQHRNETQAQVVLGECRVELDLSLVDRIADLIAPTPFFEPLYARSRVDSINRKEMHLSEDLFSNVQSKEPAAATRWKVSSNKMTLDLRVPIADLRNPNASRLPYKQKNVHPEFVRLTIKEPSIDIPVNDESTTVSLACAELTGEFLGVSEDLKLSPDDLKFLFASRLPSGPVRFSFEYDPRNKSLKASAHMHFPTACEDMTRSFTASMMQSQPKREGPFSQVRRAFCSSTPQQQESDRLEFSDEIIQAGSRSEMNQFAEQSLRQSTSIIRLDIPLLRLFIVNHEFLEILYNRLVNDLALWQPAAPALTKSESDLQINALGDKFHEYKHDKDEDDDLQDESLPSIPAYDRSKSHNFSFLMNVGKATMLMGTTMKQNGNVFGKGQAAVNLHDAQLFTVVGYHADMNRMFFHFTTNTIGIGHRNSTSFDKRGMMPTNISAKEFGKWHRDESFIDCIQESEQFYAGREKDALAVALDMFTRPEENVKDVLIALAVRNTTAKLRPFRDSGHLWVTQLIDLFTLQDYAIPGYELPLVTNDIHVHFENFIVAYDHNTVNPSSNTRLRFVIGETHITSSLIANMDVSKFTCIFDNAQVWMANERQRESVHFEGQSQKKDNSFVRVGEMDLLHLEVLNCMLSEDQLSRRRSPLVEVRCKNDKIKVWTCADSLVALINVFSEISESEAFKPIPEEEFFEAEEADATMSSIAESDDTRSEAAASTWSRPSSTMKPSPNKLPVNIEQKLMAMIGSAVRETPYKPTETIPVGTDALDEFKSDFCNTLDLQEDLSHDSNSGRYRMHSLTSDDEFLMVDDGVIGCGITSADGAPSIKVIGDVDLEDSNVDPHHFRIPDEWRADGLGALQESFPPPLIRYMVRDVSVHIHLYGGSDFATEEPAARPYSCEEFRNGAGKGQKVTTESKGGEHRDHSVSVVIEFNKINFLYQFYNKDAPVMCTNLMSVYDIVVKDRLQMSNIDELLYQYSNSEQPRRTCAPVLAARIVESHQQEGRMMVSMLPIKINLDQDTFNYIQDFIEEVTGTMKLPVDVATAASNRPMIEVAATRNPDKRKASAVEKPATLNLEPLTPSPVQPPSPLGDLNYLVNRYSSTDSPLRHPLVDAPLTESAVSIGNLFGTKSRMTNRTSTPDSDKADSPDFFFTESRETSKPTSSSEMEESLHLNDNLFDGMEGDWRSSSGINYTNLLSDAIKEPAVDDLLAQSTMEGSFHPAYTTDSLVDTSTDLKDLENDRSTVCDEDEGTEMAASGCDGQDEEGDQPVRGTTFFKEFSFSPAATIYLDYQGKKRFSMDKGGLMGVMTAIGQLNQAEIVLKEIHHNNGLLGVGRCFNHAANEWAEDIKKNLPILIASCGPISPVVQISKGFMDLFWMPVAEMRKEDGHVVKGLQKGVGSFGLSSAAGIVGIAQSLVGMVQTVAETVLHEVQPDSAFLNRRNRRISYRQAVPTDVRHGMQLAYGIVSDGVRQTRTDLELAAQEERASGNSGVRSVLRFVTPTVLRPLVMGTQISYQILGGLRNQLRPDMYQDERHKWRDDEVPGGRG